MAAKSQAFFFQTREPANAGADPGRVIKQASLFFLPRQTGELGMQGMSGMKEGFLAMQDYRLPSFSLLLLCGLSELCAKPNPPLRTTDSSRSSRCRVVNCVGENGAGVDSHVSHKDEQVQLQQRDLCRPIYGYG